jgi:hypothetical protein
MYFAGLDAHLKYPRLAVLDRFGRVEIHVIQLYGGQDPLRRRWTILTGRSARGEDCD